MIRNLLPLLLATIALTSPDHAQSIAEPQRVGVPFYVQPGTSQVIPLESHSVKVKVVARDLVSFELDTEHSPVRISETKPQFIVKLGGIPNQDTTDQLILLDTVPGKRTSRFTVVDRLAQPMVGKQIEYEFKKFGVSSYLIRPLTPLSPGEYMIGFGMTAVVYFFGIEPGATNSIEEKSSTITEAVKTDNPNQERLKKLDDLLAKGLINKADYDTRREEILHPPAPKPVTTEDRLRSLDDLFKKGLIDKADYEKKRADILSEM
jgi:hypothetical protein